MTTTPSYLQDTVAWLRGQARQCTELADRLEIVMAGPPPERPAPAAPPAAQLPGGQSPAKPLKARPSPQRGLRDRLRVWMIRLGKGAEFEVAAAAKALGYSAKDLSSACSNMRKKGEVERTGSGRYRVLDVAVPPTTEGYEARKPALGLDEPPAQPDDQA